MRSLDCLTGVATFNSVRITVDGCAVAKAVWARVWVRSACCRTEAPHAKRRRVALARKVVADVRSLWRSLFTALLAFSPLPRAQYTSSDTCCGGGASQDVTTHRGLSPAAMTSALTMTRHGCSHEAAAEAQSS
jgi:hypothetical protein